MSTTHGHKYSTSTSQNHRAQLANAYNELGKELSSSKIRVVGNYTLGKVIGEGELDSQLPDQAKSSEHRSHKVPMAKFGWERTG
jgi:hypothetical protein